MPTVMLNGRASIHPKKQGPGNPELGFGTPISKVDLVFRQAPWIMGEPSNCRFYEQYGF